MSIPPASTVVYIAQSGNVGSYTTDVEGRGITIDANKNVYYVASVDGQNGTFGGADTINGSNYKSFSVGGGTVYPHNEIGIGKISATASGPSGQLYPTYTPNVEWTAFHGDMMPAKQDAIMSGGDIAVDASGNVFVGYAVTGNLANGSAIGSARDVVMAKLDQSGNLVNAIPFTAFNASGGGESNYRPFIEYSATNNKIYGAHNTTGTIPGGDSIPNNAKVVVWRMDPTNFTIDYAKELSDANPTGAFLGLKGMDLDETANMYLIGQTSNDLSGFTNLGNSSIVWVQKFDADGNHVWDAAHADYQANPPTGTTLYPKVTTDGNDEVYATYRVPNGYRIPGAPVPPVDSIGNDIAVFKLDASGGFQWAKQLESFNTTSNENFPHIAGKADGGAFLTYMTAGVVGSGVNQKTGTGTFNIVIGEFDPSGTLQYALQLSTFNALDSGIPGATTGLFEYENNAIASYGTHFIIGAETNKALPGGTVTGSHTDIGIIAFSTLIGVPGPAPNTPRMTTIRPVCTPGAIKIWWSPNPSGQQPDSYLVGIGGGNNYAFSTIRTLGNLNFYTFTGLTNGENYSTYVQAIYYNGYSEAAFYRNVQPGHKPGPPTNQAVTTDSANFAATLTWDPPSPLPDADIGWYVTSNVATGARSNTVASVTTLTYDDLAPGVFQYTIQAVNDPGYSPGASTVTVNNPFTYYSFDNNTTDYASRFTMTRTGATNFDASDKKVGEYSLEITPNSTANTPPTGRGNITSALDNFRTFSWVGWAKWVDSGAGSNQYLFSFGSDISGSADRIYLDVKGASGKPEFHYVYNGTDCNITAASDISGGVWTHFGVTIGSNAATLYIDGTSVGSTGIPTQIRNLNMTSNVMPYQFVGRIDDVGIFNRALSASQMTNIYSAQNSDPTNALINLSSFLFQSKDGLGNPSNYSY